MGHFPAKSAVSQPICEGEDTHGRKILAKSVSDGWSPETLHSVVSLMTATLLSLQGHFCPSFTPIEKKISSSDAKFVWFNLTPCTWDIRYKWKVDKVYRSVYASVTTIIVQCRHQIVSVTVL